MGVIYDKANNQIKLTISPLVILLAIISILIGVFSLSSALGPQNYLQNNLPPSNSPDLFSLFFGGVFLAIGLIVLFKDSLRVVTIRKETDSWILKYKQGFLGKAKEEKVKAKLEKIVIESFWRVWFGNVKVNVISLLFENGQELKVVFGGSVGLASVPGFIPSYNAYTISSSDAEKIGAFFKTRCELKTNY